LGEEASGPFSWSQGEQADRKTQARDRRLLAGELFVNVESVSQGARAALVNCRYQAWLLKNSIFQKTAKIWGIENVCQNGDRRL
jgi:hypothetical protein